MTWLVIGIMAAGATTTGVLLARVERVRMRATNGDTVGGDAADDGRTVSAAVHRG